MSARRPDVRDLVIRDARAADAPALTAMVRRSGAYAGEYRVMVAPLVVDAAYLQANPTRVGVDGDGVVVGFAALLLPGRGAPGEAELDYLFVADDRQGHGIGRRLLADAVRMCRQRGVGPMHVVSHPPAEGFYRAMGAVRVGDVPPTGRITWSRPLLRLDVDTDTSA
jgi:GNAT superfamily N-acetyltransferase